MQRMPAYLESCSLHSSYSRAPKISRPDSNPKTQYKQVTLVFALLEVTANLCLLSDSRRRLIFEPSECNRDYKGENM